MVNVRINKQTGSNSNQTRLKDQPRGQVNKQKQMQNTEILKLQKAKFNSPIQCKENAADMDLDCVRVRLCFRIDHCGR